MANKIETWCDRNTKSENKRNKRNKNGVNRPTTIPGQLLLALLLHQVVSRAFILDGFIAFFCIYYGNVRRFIISSRRHQQLVRRNHFAFYVYCDYKRLNMVCTRHRLHSFISARGQSGMYPVWKACHLFEKMVGTHCTRTCYYTRNIKYLLSYPWWCVCRMEPI